ncbi:MAG: cysteine desulfurase [Verrucomicrobiales bacterium]|nr:cysteine desulfurase [Verrucomicrobiales bacterium]
MRQVYLDHLSATPLLPEAFEAMKPFFLEAYGNASSLHQQGLRVRDALAKARTQVGALINAESAEDILFTSCGTESVNLAVKGVAYANKRRGNHIVWSEVEHPAVLSSIEFLEKEGFTHTKVPVDATGRLQVDRLKEAITEKTTLICVQAANHDIGTLQPVAEAGKIAAERGIPLFVDANSSAGWLPIDVQKLGAHLVSLSPHRFYGPKGVGVLYRNRKARVVSILHGGVQENGRRAGTENVPAIVGAGVAAEVALREMTSRIDHVSVLQSALWKGLKSRIPYIRLNGPDPGPGRICNNINISTEFIEGEGQLLMLDLKGISVASGSSCVSKSLKISHVLAAIGLDHALAQGNLILTLGKDNTAEEMDYVVDTFAMIVERLRTMSPMWEEFQRGIIDSVIQPTGRGKSFSEHAAAVSGKPAH